MIIRMNSNLLTQLTNIEEQIKIIEKLIKNNQLEIDSDDLLAKIFQEYVRANF